MPRTSLIRAKQLIALLLMAVMLLVHLSKLLHTHHGYSHENHKTSCAICEFQMAKDATFTGEMVLVSAPVFIAPTYSRLLTSINPDGLFMIDGRGPPTA